MPRSDDLSSYGPYIRKIKDLILQAAVEAKIDKETAYEITDQYFSHMDRVMKSVYRPRIRVPILGIFSWKCSNFKLSFRKSLRVFREGRRQKSEIDQIVRDNWVNYKRRHQEKIGKFNPHEFNYVGRVINKEHEKWGDGIKTVLPDNYFDLKGREFIRFLRQNRRQKSSQSIIHNCLLEYNALTKGYHWDEELGEKPYRYMTEYETLKFRTLGPIKKDLAQLSKDIRDWVLETFKDI